MSTNMSTSGTIRRVFEANEDMRLFPDMMDTFSGKQVTLGKILRLLKTAFARMDGLCTRVAILESQADKKNPPLKKLDWKELTSLAEFRIAEHNGRIAQQELQRELEIGSRTTMTQLVNILKRSGRYAVRKRGRHNLIERLQ
jgi:hypothetical protein